MNLLPSPGTVQMWTKLRPGVRPFLARAAQLFELHICTMGDRDYAVQMAALLDPTRRLFAERIISSVSATRFARTLYLLRPRNELSKRRQRLPSSCQTCRRADACGTAAADVTAHHCIMLPKGISLRNLSQIQSRRSALVLS